MIPRSLFGRNGPELSKRRKSPEISPNREKGRSRDRHSLKQLADDARRIDQTSAETADARESLNRLRNTGGNLSQLIRPGCGRIGCKVHQCP